MHVVVCKTKVAAGFNILVIRQGFAVEGLKGDKLCL